LLVDPKNQKARDLLADIAAQREPQMG